MGGRGLGAGGDRGQACVHSAVGSGDLRPSWWQQRVWAAGGVRHMWDGGLGRVPLTAGICPDSGRVWSPHPCPHPMVVTCSCPQSRSGSGQGRPHRVNCPPPLDPTRHALSAGLCGRWHPGCAAPRLLPRPARAAAAGGPGIAGSRRRRRWQLGSRRRQGLRAAADAGAVSGRIPPLPQVPPTSFPPCSPVLAVHPVLAVLCQLLPLWCVALRCLADLGRVRPVLAMSLLVPMVATQPRPLASGPPSTPLPHALPLQPARCLRLCLRRRRGDGQGRPCLPGGGAGAGGGHGRSGSGGGAGGDDKGGALREGYLVLSIWPCCRPAAESRAPWLPIWRFSLPF